MREREHGGSSRDSGYWSFLGVGGAGSPPGIGSGNTMTADFGKIPADAIGLPQANCLVTSDFEDLSSDFNAQKNFLDNIKRLNELNEFFGYKYPNMKAQDDSNHFISGNEIQSDPNRLLGLNDASNSDLTARILPTQSASRQYDAPGVNENGRRFDNYSVSSTGSCVPPNNGVVDPLHYAGSTNDKIPHNLARLLSGLHLNNEEVMSNRQMNFNNHSLNGSLDGLSNLKSVNQSSSSSSSLSPTTQYSRTNHVNVTDQKTFNGQHHHRLNGQLLDQVDSSNRHRIPPNVASQQYASSGISPPASRHDCVAQSKDSAGARGPSVPMAGNCGPPLPPSKGPFLVPPPPFPSSSDSMLPWDVYPPVGDLCPPHAPPPTHAPPPPPPHIIPPNSTDILPHFSDLPHSLLSLPQPLLGFRPLR